IEIADGAPRGLEQIERDRDPILDLASGANLALVAGSNNHGWTRTAPAWNLLRIPGWRGMTPREIDQAIIGSVERDRRRAVQVVSRRLPLTGASTGGTLAAMPMAGWRLLTGLSGPQRLSWLLWIWGGAAAAAAVRASRTRLTR